MGMYGDSSPCTCFKVMEGSSKSSASPAFPLQILKDQHVTLDWGQKRTGWIQVAGRGEIQYQIAGDERIFPLFERKSPDKAINWPSSCVTSAVGELQLTPDRRNLCDTTHAFRYIRLVNRSGKVAVIDSIRLIPSEFPEIPSGKFQCDREIINIGWKMGLDTVHLCTQPGDQSFLPVYPPFGNGYVQWDGCRRDREIWGGDLRPSALCWYYNFSDDSPILNSLYLLLSGQHVACPEHGAFPGSGSTRQLLPEWCFWIVTALWEYILHTGKSLPDRFLKYTLGFFLEWCERKLQEGKNAFLPGSATWMYTFNFDSNALPGIQTSALHGLNALSRLFLYLGQPDKAQRADNIKTKLAEYITENMYDPSYGTLAINIKNNGLDSYSDLVSTCWALEAGLFENERASEILQHLKKLHWTDSGSINVAPVPKIESLHNNNIWPFANAYEFSARLHYNDPQNALELFTRYISNIHSQGHNTLFEMIHIDGSLPIDETDGNTLSFCHAWGGLGSWALQRYLLGASPTTPGWQSFSLCPVISKLKYCKGTIVTPRGLITAEIESDGTKLTGKLEHPGGMQCTHVSDTAGSIEILAKKSE